MKIHGIVYIVISIIVLVFANSLDAKKFTLFIWAAYLMLAIGVFKTIVSFVTKEKKEEQAIMHTSVREGKATPQGYYCRACRGALTGRENYCSHCGARLR